MLSTNRNLFPLCAFENNEYDRYEKCETSEALFKVIQEDEHLSELRDEDIIVRISQCILDLKLYAVENDESKSIECKELFRSLIKREGKAIEFFENIDDLAYYFFKKYRMIVANQIVNLFHYKYEIINTNLEFTEKIKKTLCLRITMYYSIVLGKPLADALNETLPKRVPVGFFPRLHQVRKLDRLKPD